MIVALVPVLDRPANVAPLIESFRSAGGPARLLFIASLDDEAELQALRNENAEHLIADWEPERADYARKIQAGYWQTTEPWIFTGADDLRFHRGWAEKALALANATGKRVIGTADLGNPEVRRGETATHLLIARSYVEQHGVFDAPGHVFSQAYSHNWVDREAVQVAKHRGEWAFCAQSVVEHLHFHWGKGETDATYRKGLLDFNADRKIYARRMRSLGIRTR